MKIAIFSDTYPPEINGVATSCRNLYRTLTAHGQEVRVVTTNPWNEELFEDGDIIRIPGIKLKKLYGYRAAPFFNRHAMNLIHDFHPDVIHSQHDAGIGQFGFIAAGRLNVPVVYTFHTMYEDYTYYATKGFLDRVAKGIVRQYIHHKSKTADEFICPSNKIKEYMRSIGIDSYVSVIPTGIDFAAFDKKKTSRKTVLDLKKKFGIPTNAYVILSLGRVAKEKSIDICLRGYAKYLEGKPSRETAFVVVGGGPALSELKRLAAKLGIDKRVYFVGPVNPDEVPKYYQLGNCFVSASITETQGLTFMEAMASSLVLFARYDDTLLGTIKDGSNGFFFIDEDDFARKLPSIVSLSGSRLQAIKDNALASIEPYSLERFYTNVMEVYGRAVKKGW